ncbi:MAG: YgjV family protein [Clostridia bacterium]|nr:YgjV family protein [Clostridia bacterium]
MWVDICAQIVSFFALALIVISYFVDKKSYLFFQALGMIGLAVSYLLTGEYFAMVALGVALSRALVFYGYERKKKDAPLFLSFLFAGLTVLAYLIVNLGIQKTAKFADILYLIAMIFFAFTFRIRDLKLMRYITLVPTALSVVYGFLCNATIFVIITYFFELAAVVVAIFRYHVFNKKNNN